MCNIACSPAPAALDCLLAPPCCLAGLFSSGLDHAVPTGAGSLWSLQGQLPMRPVFTAGNPETKQDQKSET